MKKTAVFLAVFIFISGIACSRGLAEPEHSASGGSISLYRLVSEKKLEVTGDILNVRTGPDVTYPIVGSASKGNELIVLGAFGEWYLVCLPDGSVGVVSSRYTKVTLLDEDFSQTPEGDGESGEFEGDDSDVGAMFRLANKDRKTNGLPAFVWDERLNDIARLKAQDMLNNRYFGHNSPVYGTPFTMLKQMGILYKTASENIARNESVEKAHSEIMESPAHRSNILNTRYDKMGIGIVESGVYGKIIVQIFIEE